ncbi:hypothetical protein [Helicobacter suis]|uniref:hypothetical protein n=1 Tax=Helicobacter suis TaxID=104628 RepID=UPI0013D1CE22|nr:hypothetical protein [Helicobacter suis]
MKDKQSNKQSTQDSVLQEALNTPTSEVKHLKQATNLRECKKEQESLYTDLQNLPLQEALKELRVRGVEFVELGEIGKILGGLHGKIQVLLKMGIIKLFKNILIIYRFLTI